MFAPDPAPLEVELLVIPDVTLLQVATLLEPMRAANRLLGRTQFRWRITTPDGAPAPTRAGVPIPAQAAFDPVASAAPLFVVASYALDAGATPGLTRRLARAGRARPIIGGVESGVWLLARAGLLTGRRATLHWEDLDAFAAAFPDIRVVAQRYVIDGNRFSTGGAGPALDLMLELIRRRLGDALSLEVAKAFLYERAPGLDRVPGLRLAGPAEPHVARAVRAMEARLDEPLPVARLAGLAGCSPRHLGTLFRRAFGVAPQAHYVALRLAHARRLLIETRAPVMEIAASAGFASPAAFARAYRRRHGESPTETRARAAAPG